MTPNVSSSNGYFFYSCYAILAASCHNLIELLIKKFLFIQALNRIGLRVVLDVVYNHVHASGPSDDNSVLDKVVSSCQFSACYLNFSKGLIYFLYRNEIPLQIVPGYYLRRNSDGFIENSTCVNNTASEHIMVERLIIDDLLHWAVEYKVIFRLDHDMLDTLSNLIHLFEVCIFFSPHFYRQYVLN